MKRTFRLAVKVAGAASAVLLILSTASVYLSPEDFPYAVYAGLLYLPLMLANIFFFVFFLIRIGRISALISAVGIVCAALMVPRLWQWPYRDTGNAEGIHIMSYNSHLFDAYDWRNPGVVRDNIFAYLRRVNPDIFMFQEFYLDKTGIFKTRDSIQQLFDMPYCTDYYSDTVKGLYLYGIATISRYPIVHQEARFFKGSQNLFIASDIILPWDTVRVINCHLQSIRFNADDYRTIGDKDNMVDNIPKLRIVLGKIHRASAYRAVQTAELVRYASQSPHPVIVGGDFNDPPLSYTYQHIRGSLGLEDAFVQSGTGLGGTYNGSLPSYRIDYILHDPSISSSAFEVHRIPYSDHFPVSCYIRKAE